MTRISLFTPFPRNATIPPFVGSRAGISVRCERSEAITFLEGSRGRADGAKRQKTKTIRRARSATHANSDYPRCISVDLQHHGLFDGSRPNPGWKQCGRRSPGTGDEGGVIDIGFIFDNHPTMKPQMKAIDDQMQQAEDEINNRRVAMQKELESMRSLNEASLDYKKKEEYIADQESKLKLDFVRKEKEFSLARPRSSTTPTSKSKR